MLNKIKIVGEVFLPIKKSKKYEAEENDRGALAYFSLRVPTPSNSLSILRCLARGEVAEKLEQETQPGDVLEISGYLRNEKESRQILIMVIKFAKLEIKPAEINPETSNQVQLIGKIITDLQTYQTPDNPSAPVVLSFKLSVPREKNEFPLYFCRAQGQLVNDIYKQLKKNDIIFLEGYLQTVKVASETSGSFEERESRISSIIVQGFTLLGSDLVDDFTLPGKFARVFRAVEKIDFSKESPKKVKKAVEE
ncbi:MAG: single-stranded DNA-binding protein [Candidatus Moeniiplasma glomeromycotorum]|nr:single-stranded DNA-binding protein [Candidatus Moeniiplasma glomeromycotorum]MCE8167458.1 single-stranded DNA-binding protein [Candidatus Moeniiplasma glomeromycotorum]MCE8168528.1 single-stranded DNA-binding protein [Candidatus Moeniiplasma glomeromycotorum]